MTIFLGIILYFFIGIALTTLIIRLTGWTEEDPPPAVVALLWPLAAILVVVSIGWRVGETMNRLILRLAGLQKKEPEPLEVEEAVPANFTWEIRDVEDLPDDDEPPLTWR